MSNHNHVSLNSHFITQTQNNSHSDEDTEIIAYNQQKIREHILSEIE